MTVQADINIGAITPIKLGPINKQIARGRGRISGKIAQHRFPCRNRPAGPALKASCRPFKARAHGLVKLFTILIQNLVNQL